MFSGEVAGENAFRRDLEPGWTLVLAVAPHGWVLRIEDSQAQDLSSLTPPRMSPNPRELFGWHFRNAENTGTNTGDVNAPQHLREFVFATEPWEGEPPVAPGGRGWLRIDDMGLADLEPGQQARMVYLRFTVCLSWPQGAGLPIVPPDPVLVERFRACGLDPSLRLTAFLHPGMFETDLDGDDAWDLVALVERVTDGKRAVAICRSGTWLHVLGLEGEMGHLTPAYYDRMDWWGLMAKGPVYQGVEEGDPPTLLGDAIVLGIEGASSVLIYWNGDSFSSYWQGD